MNHRVSSRLAATFDQSGSSQPIDAACFLGFDGLIAPSARWPAQNAMLFTDRIAPAELILVESDRKLIDWRAWRKAQRKPGS